MRVSQNLPILHISSFLIYVNTQFRRIFYFRFSLLAQKIGSADEGRPVNFPSQFFALHISRKR